MSAQFRDHRGNYPEKAAGTWKRIINKLVYLPGAMVMIYGFWLSLSA